MPTKNHEAFPKLILGTLLTLFFTSTSGQECAPPKVALTINGVFTNPDGARLNMAALKFSWIKSTNSPANMPFFDWVDNPTGDNKIFGDVAVADILETFSQHHGLELAKLLNAIAGYEKLPDSVSASFIELSSSLIKQSNPDLATLLDMKARVERYLYRGNIVTLVPHSQGNLFANSIALLRPAGSISNSALGIVGVAVPDSKVENSHAPYVTLSEDQVIKYFRILNGDTLPANTSNHYPDVELNTRIFSHGFIAAYLDEEKDSEKKIISSIDTTFQQLQSPICASSLFDTYLPKVLAGRTSSVSSCGPNKVPGTITIAPTGEYSGSGCYASLTFGPYRSLYDFTIGPATTATGEFTGVHKSFGAPNFLVTQDAARLFVRGGVRAATATNNDAQSTSNVLDIDPAIRMMGWLDFISKRPCNASYPGQIPQAAFIDRSATEISIKSDTATLLSAKLSDVLEAPPSALQYHELFRNNNSLLVTYSHAGEHSRNNALTLNMVDPAVPDSKFDFTLSKEDESGQPRALTCKK
jgi:hypothetical protein